ncbi:MAG: UvrD-helicase domain-containing protein [Myxococcales bacterium]|nr:UvrD-helicase domain-containing protein [Myxococcota bacterium]MDW8281049.1 UvrD-helicase domain-containing protein [Myxococcales bacterium]
MFALACLADLNPSQREAVTTTEGPLLVLAGAGSGKTRVITHRIAYLMSLGVPANAIVAVSFTNKAADEMRERLMRLVPPRSARDLTLCTFHSLGLHILRAEQEALGLPGGFTIYDTADQLGVIREILRHAHLQDRRLDAKAILSRISRLKNAGVSAEAFLDQLRRSRFVSEYDGYAAEVYPRYQARMRALCAFDFDDLLVETLRLLREQPEVRQRWQRRFRYLMIDEYQDTNRCQLELLRILCEPHRNLAVVGDDDQSIYSWRGAEPRNILDFTEQFPGARVIKLEENYRSSSIILQAANAVIRKIQGRHDKTLFTRRAGGEPIQLVIAPDGEAEARFVAEEIDLLRSRHGLMLGDIAVLYRSNAQAALFEEELRQAQIGYRLIGGQTLFDRKEIKDAIAYLQLLVHPHDEISLRRVINYPARGIGEATLARLESWQRQAGVTLWQACLHACRAEDSEIAPRVRAALAAFVDCVQRHRQKLAGSVNWANFAREYLVEMGVPDDLIRAGPTVLAAQRRLRNLEGFLDALGRFQERSSAGGAEALRAYLQRLVLSSQEDDATHLAGDLVTLSTLHGAKGLEFRVVFLVGMEEGLLPHRRTLAPREVDLSEAGGVREAADLGEERRLCYVGITRARERLYLCRAQLRGSRLSQTPRTPSRFLEDIPVELLVSRDLESPGGGMSAEEEEEFARQQLRNMLKMTE